MSGLVFSIFDGSYKTELDVVPNWESVLNGVGACEFPMALRDPKCTEENLQFGNIICFPEINWWGLLDTPRKWGGYKVLSTAYELNSMLTTSDTPANLKIKGTAGALFTQLCSYITDQGIAPIIMGDVFMGGDQREETLGQTPLDHIQQVAGRCGYDFSVSAKVVNGRVKFYGNFYEGMGSDQDKKINKTNLRFKEESFIAEDGRIVNVQIGLGDASTNGTRLETPPQMDDESISLYGRRRASRVFSGNRELTTLMQNTLRALRASKQPKILNDFYVLNKNNLFDALGLGNRLPFDAPYACFKKGGGFGINGRLRILGMGGRLGVKENHLVSEVI